MSLASEPQTSGTKPATGLRSQQISVDTTAHSIGGDITSRGIRSGLSRTVSDPTSGGPLERVQIPTRHSEQTPGTLTPDWVYKGPLLDKWAFLAKTALIVHRLRARPSDEVIVRPDITQASQQFYLHQDSTRSQLRSTGSGAFGDLPPGEPLEAASASPPTFQVASTGRSPGMVVADSPQGISMQSTGQQPPPRLPIPTETTKVRSAALQSTVFAVPAVVAVSASAVNASATKMRVGDAGRDMLHLDDELAGLMEAADMPAAQHGAHTTQLQPASSVPDEAEQSDSDETWRSLLWIPLTTDEPAGRIKLHLDDELAGLMEAADMPAPKADTHSTKPELVSSVPGVASLAPSESAEHVMLRLDDEIAGLFEAAEVPADQDKTHSSQPDAVLPVPDEAELRKLEQTWHRLLWISPLADEPAGRDMLRLDDELAGLVEAADMPADSHGAHSTKPEAVSSMPEAPAAGVLPPAPVADQGHPKQIVPSYAQVRAGGMLSLDAEMAGLIEAADMPAGEDKTHGAKADAVSTVQDEAEQSDVEQSWPGLSWVPPADDKPSGRDMLCLDDELAGLMEAADMPADQHGAHTTQLQPASSVPGMAGLAHPGDTEHVVLHLNDEMAGLIEAAEVPADSHGAHSAKPDPASSVPDEAEQSDSFESWPGLFWLPPADDNPSKHDMLRLDDELAGLMEAAEVPADSHGAHATQPEAASSVPEPDDTEWRDTSHARVNGMLRLDDELAGLIEAADMLADQQKAHSSDAVSPVLGRSPALHSTPAVALRDEESDSEQSWPGLFWLPPADDEPAGRDMLCLDDELAGLIEAADMPADQHKMHATKPEPVSPVPGMPGLAPSGDAEGGMLRLDDEIAGLVEAADVPVAPDSAHSTVPEAVLSVPEQSWPGLFWLPPAHDGPVGRGMLRLDDELAGLMEAADMPADQHDTHTTKPRAASPRPGADAVEMAVREAVAQPKVSKQIVMLHLDDELAGLIEAAEVPADQHGTHSTKPDALSPMADEAEQSDSFQSWPGLFWLPPADDKPAGRDMLRLDDELAGLIEAADMPADQHDTHSAKPRVASLVPGADAASMAGSAAVAEQRNPEQNVMLRLDDELAGLLEAAGVPADSHGAHNTQPQPASSTPDEAKQSASFESWPGLWLPPGDVETSKRDMLRLDDELAGLMEAADTPADSHGAHTTKPEAASSVPGAHLAKLAPEAEQKGSEHNVMLRLDDEIAGLIEAAEVPADQHGAHSTKPEPASSVPDEAEQSDSFESWPGLFWLPPIDAEFSKRDMLRLDDEVAGLLEVAEVPADQHGAHTTKPEPATSVPGVAGLAPSEDAAPAEHAMLRLDDEIAGLVEAAEVPADSHGTHSTKSEPASAVSEDDSEHTDSYQSWPGLFWLPPADDEPAGRDMLRLDDELAGLMEAADIPADQHGAHTTQPGPVSPMPGLAATEGTERIMLRLNDEMAGLIEAATMPDQHGAHSTQPEAASSVPGETDQGDLDQTWQRLLWIPPSNDEPAVRGMLRLDDELAGLMEAADMPANQHGGHTTKPEPALSLQGMAALAQSRDAEHVMLRLDDEIAGLIEAAEVPADQDKAHSSQPDAVSPVQEQDNSFQSWPGLFWLPPADDKPSKRVMLRLDDELAGLVEAADMPADQHGGHPTQPEPVLTQQGVADLAPSDHAEHVMLRLDDEMAGLMEAAEVPADQHGTHSSDAVSPVPEYDDSYQSWPGLFWLPPADDKPSERDMLGLDDELAGLMEAADIPADQHGAHSTQPEAVMSLRGMAGLAPSGDPERGMLRLDDEIAGLLEAAEVRADQHGAHSSDAASPLPEQDNSEQSWPGLFWLPPADGEPAGRDMLCLDDELACLMEAADMPADQHGAHTTKPEPVLSLRGMAPFGDAERGMLCLDDELAGLIEAAEVPTDQHGAHSSHAVSPVQEPDDSEQSWPPGLFWLPPADNEISKRDMLRLDDELTGLIEAADMPADSHGAHTTQPEPVLSLRDARMDSSGDTEHVMLRLDDEMAGLIEAADMPADQHGAHSSDAVSPVPEQDDLEQSWPGLFWLPPAANEPAGRDMLRLDDEIARLAEAADMPADQHGAHTAKPEAASSVPDSPGVLLRLDDEMAGLIEAAEVPADSHGAHSTKPEPASSVLDEAEQSDSFQSWPGLFWLPPASDKPSKRDMLCLDDELAGLMEAADPSADAHGAHTTQPEPASSSAEDTELAEGAMLDLNAEVSGLVPPEEAEPAGHAVLDPHTADVDDTAEDLATSAATAAFQALSYAPAASSGTSQTDRLGVEDELSGLIAAAAASQDESDHKHSGDAQRLAASEDAEPAEHAVLSPRAEVSEPDSYEDDTFDDSGPMPAGEGAGAAATSPDVPLDSIYKADMLEGAEAGDRATAEEADVVMPERPSSPVAMQLAIAAAAGVAATAAATSALHVKSAPARLAGDQGVVTEQAYGDDAYANDVFELVDTKSEDGLVSSAQRPAGDEEVCSEAGSRASSDLDDVTQAQADAQPAIGTQGDESHANEMFGMEAEQSQLQTDDSQAEPSGELSSSHDSAAQYSAAQASAAQASAAVASAPQPPPKRNLDEARRPARPSRAFIRREISLTQPDSSRPGPPAADPLPAMPQAPAGTPPRHRARQHAPLGHQLSHSGKGSIGQPARIEAFWPVKGGPDTTPLVPLQAATPRAASTGKKRAPKKRAFASSPPRQAQGAGPDSPRAAPGQEQPDMVDLQELGRPLERPLGRDGGVSEKKSGAGVQLTRHLEYDILQCIAKNRPEHLSWLVVKAREMGVRPSNPAVAAANTICKLSRRQAVSKAPPLLTEELHDMRASLMALDNIYHRHGIMPGAVRSSPAFDNASKALQRLTLDNEAAAAVATGDWQAMEQVLEVARAHNNPVVVRRLEASLNRLEAEASGAGSSRSMRSPRGLEGAIRLRDLASPVQPRSGHSPRAPSPARGQVPPEVVRRLEEHDDQQAAVHLAWLAQKDEQRRRQQARAAAKLRRLPDWYLHTAALRPRIDSQDFATWRESHAHALQEKSADQMSMMYIQTVEAELRKFRQEYMSRYNYARELNWQDDHVHVKHQLFDNTLEKQPSNVVISMPYIVNSDRAYK